MPVVVLYTQDFNPYSEKVARVLSFKGVSYARRTSDDPEDYRRWSPVTGQLPVLEIDGRRRAESRVILDWLDELFAQPPLWSSDALVGQKQRRLAEWADTSFVWYWNRWRAAAEPQPGDDDPAPPGLLSRVRGGLLRALAGSETPLGRRQLRELEIVEELAKRVDELLGMLGDRPFFHSQEPSGADFTIYGMLQAMRASDMLAGRRMIEERPALVAFMERVEQRTGPPTLGSGSRGA